MSNAANKRAKRQAKYAYSFSPRGLEDIGEVSVDFRDDDLSEIVTAVHGHHTLTITRTSADFDAPYVADMERWEGDTITAVSGPLVFTWADVYTEPWEPAGNSDEDLFGGEGWTDPIDVVVASAWPVLVAQLAHAQERAVA